MYFTEAVGEFHSLTPVYPERILGSGKIELVTQLSLKTNKSNSNL